MKRVCVDVFIYRACRTPDGRRVSAECSWSWHSCGQTVKVVSSTYSRSSRTASTRRLVLVVVIDRIRYCIIISIISIIISISISSGWFLVLVSALSVANAVVVGGKREKGGW